MSKKLVISSTLLVAIFAACGDDGNNSTPDAAPMVPDAAAKKSIVGVASDVPTLSTLVAVVQFASDNGDLVNLLSNPGTLTVFAPSNAAFDALAVELTGNGGAKATDLLTPANKPLLRQVLQYHVLSTTVKAAGIPFGKAITTAEGSIFKIDSGAPPKITDGRNRTANITSTDVEASNGVVHLIDKVILPANKDIVETAQAAAAGNPGEFKILVEAVVAADLVTALKGTGPLTVFAPTDVAFANALTELGITKAQLLAPANKAYLQRVLTYHVVAGRVLKADVPVDTDIVTLETGKFRVTPALKIKDALNREAGIAGTDILTKTGVIHVIDKVILPALPPQ